MRAGLSSRSGRDNFFLKLWREPVFAATVKSRVSGRNFTEIPVISLSIIFPDQFPPHFFDRKLSSSEKKKKIKE
jgi:hypothetical protein